MDILRPSDQTYPCPECGRVHPLELLQPLFVPAKRTQWFFWRRMVMLPGGGICRCVQTGVVFEVHPDGIKRVRESGRAGAMPTGTTGSGPATKAPPPPADPIAPMPPPRRPPPV